MPDILTPSEIAAIRAFPQHLIKVIPAGERALGYDPISFREAIRASATRDIEIRDRKETVARILPQPGETEDALILRAWSSGLNLRAIGDLIGKSHSWAYKRLRMSGVDTARRSVSGRAF